MILRQSVFVCGVCRALPDVRTPGLVSPSLSDLSVTTMSRNICTDLGKHSILQSVSIVTQQSNSHLIPLLTDPLIRRICGRLFYVD